MNVMSRLFSIIIILISLAVMVPAGHAKVTGSCSDCHTMHNSQGGSPLAFELNAGRTGFVESLAPNPTLLTSDCVGCHTLIGAATIENSVPIVFNTDEPDKPLAGGNFKYVVDDHANGHNVAGITGVDPTLGLSAPGGDVMGQQLRCAGEFGCHGDRSAGNDELSAVKGSHHTDDSAGALDGSSVGKSYRFLNGVLGIEDNDWEQDFVNTSHNEYQGSVSGSSNTISYLCAICHGAYHTWEAAPGEVGTSSPWFRHPTDIVLPADKEYQYYNGGPGGAAPAPYSMVAPLARPNLSSIAGTNLVNPGTDVVMCLSCHRAHGSPYFKMMRWDYRSWPGGGVNGCGICHTSKD